MQWLCEGKSAEQINENEQTIHIFSKPPHKKIRGKGLAGNYVIPGSCYHPSIAESLPMSFCHQHAFLP